MMYKRLIIMLLMIAWVSVECFGQGIIVYRKDGTRFKVPYTELDSVVTYNSTLVGIDPDGGRKFLVNGVSFKMMPVEAGTFQMGKSADGNDVTPVHSVTITKDYYIGETEVTQALWKAVMGQSPTTDGSQWSSSYGIGDNYPAYYISYNDVQEFITKLNDLTDMEFRMPTEAEWEFAAKGGKKSEGFTYAGSNALEEVAWYYSNSGSKTHPVAQKKSNELGLYDMSGNVWEWCSDWYGSYSSSSVSDPIGATSGSNRVRRGGSWYYDASYCRVVYRFNYSPSFRNPDIGFRLALSSSQK